MTASRWLYAPAAILVSASLVLTGCSGATGGGTAATPAASTVSIGLKGGVNTLDPHNTRSVGSDLSVIGSIYSSLIRNDGAGKEYKGDLATKWSDEGSLKWTFTLDPDAVFSDGTPVTAEDVVWNIKRVQTPANALRWAPQLDNIAEATAPDKQTVVITLKRPNAELLSTLAMFYILSPKWAETHTPATEAMGSGPYLLEAYTPKGALKLKAKDTYWGNVPAVKSVNYADLGSNDAEINALLAGEVDLITNIGPRDSQRFNGNNEVKVVSFPTARMAMVKFNTVKEPVNNPLVRQALNYAVDKQSIIDSLLLGSVKQANGQVLTESYPGYNPGLQPYAYDEGKAKSLLAEAGYPNGFELEMSVPSGQYIEGENIAQAVSAQLAKVGVTVKITTAPFAAYLDRYVGPNADMAQSMYITQAGDSTGDLLSYFRQGSPYAYFPDQEFATLLDEAKYSTEDKPEPEKYLPALERFREQAPILFLFAQPATFGMAQELQFQPIPTGLNLPAEMSIR